jgi:integrase
MTSRVCGPRLLTRERPASPSTVRRYYAILSAALNQAVKWQWLVSNPARLATLPYPRHPEPNAPSPEQVRALVAACTSASETLGTFVLVAAVTGCRRGELAALQWGVP